MSGTGPPGAGGPLGSGLPPLRPGLRLLIAGASGGIGRALMALLLPGDLRIGAHSFRHAAGLEALLAGVAVRRADVELFSADLRTAVAGQKLVADFLQWAGGIDVLVQLSGDLSRATSWRDLSPEDWDHDLAVNLSAPFFLAQAAMRAMIATGGRGGRIVLASTASARHGGGPSSIAYGVAKAGIECLVRGLARVGAPHGILVNAISPGLIDTAFHRERAGRSAADLQARAQLVPLKRAGTPEEAAGVIVFLCSDWASYVTGECLAVSGGDWL